MNEDAEPSALISTSERVPRGSRSLAARLTLYVNVVFLGNMAVFLVAGFRAERTLHYRETFHHLGETLGVLGIDPSTSHPPLPEDLAAIEAKLARYAGVAHRVLVLDATGTVLASSVPGQIGRTFGHSFQIEPAKPWHGQGTLVRQGTVRWLAVSTTALTGEPGLLAVVLLRSRPGTDEFVARFFGLHAVHAIVAIPLFALLVTWIVRARVRAPIVRLAEHIERIEQGRFEGDEAPVSEDELGWLGRRFTAMGTRLRESVESLVRAEKYATVGAIAFRVTREMAAPLDAIGRRLVMLEAVAYRDDEVGRLCTELSADRARLIEVVKRIQEIEPPESGARAPEAG